MATTGTGQVTETKDREDTEDREDNEDNLATSQEGDRSEEEAAAGNTNDYQEIVTII
jgi:hypothetical protein